MDYVNTTSGINLNYQDTGDKKAPAIILIMGLGAQMTIWPEDLYHGLVEKGFRVIRFDNRDVGKSSQLNDMGNPSLVKTWLSHKLTLRSKAPYNLEGMAEDVLEIMAALNIKKAHVVGASMGGMIAQILAAKHNKKVLSLTSIMSTTSSPKLSKSNIKIMLKLARRPSRFSREAAIRYNMKMNRLIGSPAYPTDEITLRQQATQSFERGYNPAGFKRQLVAITASGDRSPLIKKIKAPTLVIHGSDDPIIPLAGGLSTAQSIKKAKLKVIDGMGHDFPISLMPQMTKSISKHVKKSEKKRLQKKLEKKLLLETPKATNITPN